MPENPIPELTDDTEPQAPETPPAETTEPAPVEPPAEEPAAPVEPEPTEPAEPVAPAEPAKPATAPVEPAPIANDPTNAELAQLTSKRAEIDAEINALRAKPDYDAYEDGRKLNELIIQRQDIQDRRIAISESASSEQAFWTNWQTRNPNIPNGRELFQQELKEAAKEYGTGDIARAVATDRWKRAIAQAATARPAAAPHTPAIPTRTITPTGGGVLPRVNRHSPPPPAKKSAADEVLEQLGPLSKWRI